MNTKSILHYGQMVYVMCLFTITLSCSKVALEDPILLAMADSSLLTKASNPVVEFVADSIMGNICIDIYGNAYYTKHKYYGLGVELAHPFFQYHSDSKTTNVLFQVPGNIVCVDSNGNVYYTCTHYNDIKRPTVLYKRDASGNLLRDFGNMPMLASIDEYWNNAVCDVNNNVYARTIQGELVKIATLGKVSLVAEGKYPVINQIYKGKSNNLFSNSYVSPMEYNKLNIQTGELTTHSTGIPYTAMGCGMNDGGIFLLSYNTIHRLNPNNNQVIQKAIIPTSVIKDGVTLTLKRPSAIYPTPEGNAVYVLCEDERFVTHVSGILIKITF